MTMNIKPFYQDQDLTLYHGDVINTLRSMDAESISCVMTSPPYWGLRSYGTDPQNWGMDSNDGPCIHSSSAYPCINCVKWKGELGLEPTPEMFISHLADVFDAVKRVLRKDGTVWINLGDSYSGSGRGIGSKPDPKWEKARNDENKHKQDWKSVSIQAKNLCLIPSRFAIEMQNRGWILRNDIIWQKPNPMPSSVKDRMTNSYEHLFFFVKSKKYYYDLDAIREPHAEATFGRNERGISADNKWNKGAPGSTAHTMSRPRLHKNLREKGQTVHSMHKNRAEKSVEPELNPLGRNLTDVWLIATEALRDEHYAAYPQKLCERPIKAGCPVEICVKCGKPRERMVINPLPPTEVLTNTRKDADESINKINKDGVARGSGQEYDNWRKNNPPITTGWTDCGCEKDFEPGTVLDPFCGSGTTLLVARRLGRRSIGIDLKYQEIALRRLNVDQQRINL